MTTNDAPIACSLDGGDYQDRLRALERLGATALRSGEEQSDGATLRFRRDPEVRRELAAIVDAENTCCPFLGLDIEDDEETLVLSITAPREAMPVVHDLVRSFRSRATLRTNR